MIGGHAPDDQPALARVRAAMGDLLDQRDSPTWAYDLALRLEPWNVQYEKALAARLIELGRLPEAEPHLTAMVKDKPDQPRGWADRAILLSEAEEPDRAAADMAHALELLPDDFQLFGDRAKLCANSSRTRLRTSDCWP